MSTPEREVARVFARLESGTPPPAGEAPGSGWELSLPSGRTVTRSALQEEARALIALGPDAVPWLLPHVMDAEPALRYVAAFALEEITGLRHHLPLTGDADRDGSRARAVAAWKGWHDARQ